MSNVIYKLYFTSSDSVRHVNFDFIPFALSLNIQTLNRSFFWRTNSGNFDCSPSCNNT